MCPGLAPGRPVSPGIVPGSPANPDVATSVKSASRDSSLAQTTISEDTAASFSEPEIPSVLPAAIAQQLRHHSKTGNDLFHDTLPVWQWDPNSTCYLLFGFKIEYPSNLPVANGAKLRPRAPRAQSRGHRRRRQRPEEAPARTLAIDG